MGDKETESTSPRLSRAASAPGGAQSAEPDQTFNGSHPVSDVKTLGLRDGTTPVAIVGGGIVGLLNALQYAKRGVDVTLIDDVVGNKRSYKVGESLLVHSSMFLRTVGGLDEFISGESVPKEGVWFVHGAEHQPGFDDCTEWALNRQIPEFIKEAFEDQRLYRALVEDAQIVRPEAEDLMLEQARRHPRITLLDTAKVRNVTLGEGNAPHEIEWESRSTETKGSLRANWIVDCSGRARFLARRLNHVMDEQELSDGFQTTAVWAQFSNVDPEQFGEIWRYRFPDSGSAKREASTLHLWGNGYWIWVIKLSKSRISIGVTYNQKAQPQGENYEEKFWDVIRRYPIFEGILLPENVLEFRVYKNVQYMTDTFVSERRYGMVGDASTIIDAYYSQGMSHSFVASWHLANIVESGVKRGHLDREYIAHVNRSLREDWRVVRNMVREKFTPAIQDPRFFLLTHLLDAAVFTCLGVPRYQLGRWLVETDCAIDNEKPEHQAMREYLSRKLFYSQILPGVPPEVTQKVQRYLQGIIADRARWRLENGVQMPKAKSIVRFIVDPIPLWRLFGRSADSLIDISPNELKGVPKSMMFTGKERSPLPLQVGAALSIGMFSLLFAYDTVETFGTKLSFLLGREGDRRRAAPRRDVRPEGSRREAEQSGGRAAVGSSSVRTGEQWIGS